MNAAAKVGIGIAALLVALLMLALFDCFVSKRYRRRRGVDADMDDTGSVSATRRIEEHLPSYDTAVEGNAPTAKVKAGG